MNKLLLFSAFLLLFVYSNESHAQRLYSRIESDISIKEIFPDGTKSLMLGKVFFDVENNSIVYHIAFPEKETMVLKDSLVLSLKDSVLNKKLSSSQLIDFSIYKLALSGELKTFGLDETKFLLGRISENDDGVSSEWIPKIENPPFKIIISQANNKITGIALVESTGKILNKQFFKKYQKIGRISFPTEILEISYTGSGVYKKMMTHSEIKLDNYSDEINSSYDPDIDAFE
ncbi:MAG: hypothetical protein AAFQ94_30060 [Bacteroidota bacterium]